jgi:hypothetical protein
LGVFVVNVAWPHQAPALGPFAAGLGAACGVAGIARLRYGPVVWHTMHVDGAGARFDDGRGHVIDVPAWRTQTAPVPLGLGRWAPGLFAAAAVAGGAYPIWPMFPPSPSWPPRTPGSPRRARRTVRVRGDGRAYRLFVVEDRDAAPPPPPSRASG